jgi:hypothetical protein
MSIPVSAMRDDIYRDPENSGGCHYQHSYSYHIYFIYSLDSNLTTSTLYYLISKLYLYI